MSTYVRFIEGKGRGVFTDKKINIGDIIESSPVIEFPEEDWKHVVETVINSYCFLWGEDRQSGALALGYGSLYNHSYKPNAKYIRKVSEKVIDFVAIKDIEAGEEITVNYNGVPDDNEPVWFDVIE
jgi:SET domain-containing protein